VGDGLLAAAFDVSVRLAIVALVVDATTRGLRRSSPAAAHRLWMMVLAAGPALAVCAYGVRPVAFVHPAGSLGTLLPGPDIAIPIGRIAGIAYVAGVLFFALRLALGIRAVGVIVRRAVSIRGVEAAGLERVAADLGAPRVRFAQSAALGIPVTAGMFRPIILLPEDWRAWPEDRVRAVVRHEAAHVARRDYVGGLFAAAVQAVFWFHPAVWVAASRLSLCAELACDRMASANGPGDEYASHLLALASRRASPLRHGWSVGAATRLDERIDALLDDRTLPPSRVRAVAGACGACAMLLLIATPVRLVPVRVSSTAVFDHQPQPLHHAHRHP